MTAYIEYSLRDPSIRRIFKILIDGLYIYEKNMESLVKFFKICMQEGLLVYSYPHQRNFNAESVL